MICLRETETALDSLAGNRTRLSSAGSELIEMECQQMKSNENESTTHLNGSFAVPFTMTIKTIVISNQDCFDGEWNAMTVLYDVIIVVVVLPIIWRVMARFCLANVSQVA